MAVHERGDGRDKLASVSRSLQAHTLTAAAMDALPAPAPTTARPTVRSPTAAISRLPSMAHTRAAPARACQQ